MIPAERPLHSSRQARRLLRGAAALLVVAFATTGAREALADEPGSDYCRKVTATAEGDAALLLAPTVTGQVIRFPQNGFADKTGLQQGSGIQPRASLSVGFVDMYRGLGVLDVAKADCRREERAATLAEVLAQRGDIGKLPALEKKLELLRARQPEVEGLVRSAEERFAAQVTTLLEVHELRRRAAQLDRKLWDTERDIEIMKKRGFVAPEQPVAKLLEEYEARAIAHYAAVSHVRKLQPWQLNVTGGMTVQPVVDAFGVVELSYNIGGLFQGSAENRARAARTQEIRGARYEVRHQVEAMLDELRIEARRSQEQVAVLDKELARLARERASLQGLDSPHKAQVLAALTLEAIELEAERAYLSALLERQMTFGGKS